MDKNEILVEYGKKRPLYAALNQKLRDLLKEILEIEGIQVHSVTNRTKDIDSFNNKLNREGSSYSELEDITDISGIRIITYFEDQVNKCADIINREFKVDQDNSIDKGKTLDPDRFGYLSLHYIISINPDRSKLPEYRSLSKLKSEIQIRSILQHAWAEIEHDLGYKAKEDVPKLLRRRFARIAGMLELADTEFVSIRNEISAYIHDVNNAIGKKDEDIDIDKDSLSAYISSSAIISEIDDDASSKLELELNPTTDSLINRRIKHLTASNINKISKLDDGLKKYKELLKKLVVELSTRPNKVEKLFKGTGIFYLPYLIYAEQGFEALEDYIKRSEIGGPEKSKGIADIVINAYNTIVKAPGEKG